MTAPKKRVSPSRRAVERALAILVDQHLIMSEIWVAGKRNWTLPTKAETSFAAKIMMQKLQRSVFAADAAVEILARWVRKNKLRKIQFSLRNSPEGPRGIAINGSAINSEKTITRTIQINQYACPSSELDKALHAAARKHKWQDVTMILAQKEYAKRGRGNRD